MPRPRSFRTLVSLRRLPESAVHSNRRPRVGLTVMTLITLLLAACGGDAADTAATGTGGTAATSAPTGGATGTGGTGGAVPEGPTITVASFNFPESTILAEIYAQVMEDAGYPVERQLDLGARELIFPELTSANLSFLPEYVGSAIQVGFGEDAPEDLEAGVETLTELFDEQGVTVFAPAPAEDANVFAVTAEFSDTNGVTALPQLADAGDVTLSGPPECEERSTCYAGLQDVYGLDNVGFTSIQETTARVASLQSGDSQVTLLFSTDPVLAGGELVVLEDPEEMVPPENVIPVVATDVADAYGDDFTSLIDGVSEQITTELLIDLNGRAAEGQAPADIATDWLSEAGIIG